MKHTIIVRCMYAYLSIHYYISLIIQTPQSFEHHIYDKTVLTYSDTFQGR